MFAALLFSDKQAQAEGAHKMPAPEPCIVSPMKYCLSGPFPLSSFCSAIYRYAENAPGLRVSCDLFCVEQLTGL